MEVNIKNRDTPEKCPLCGLERVTIFEITDRRVFRVECRRCGNYTISREMVHDAPHRANPDLGDYLPAYVHQANRRNIEPELLSSNWEPYARSHSETPLTEKVRMMLEWIARKSKYPGDFVEVDCQLEYPIMDARSWEEAAFVLRYLGDSGFISGSSTMGGGWSGEVEILGWRQLQSVSLTKGRPGRCFVALWFDKSMDDACELGFKLAIRDCGLDPIVVRDVHFNDDVSDRILAEIRLAQFVVADFTGNRGGVYFEAGFAKGLGREVIFTCRQDAMHEVHFDTNHYNHITWNTSEDLREKLRDRIRATILPPG